MLTITELNVRADEHDRLTHEVDRYGWIRADARAERTREPRVVLGALLALVRRRPVAKAPGGILIGGNVSAPGTSPRAAT